jgi:hypothetical protein
MIIFAIKDYGSYFFFCHHNSLFLGKNKKKAIMIKDAFHRRLTFEKSER